MTIDSVLGDVSNLDVSGAGEGVKGKMNTYLRFYGSVMQIMR